MLDGPDRQRSWSSVSCYDEASGTVTSSVRGRHPYRVYSRFLSIDDSWYRLLLSFVSVHLMTIKSRRKSEGAQEKEA